MTALEEIEAAISKPPKADFERLSAWNNSNQKYQTDWDRQIQEDSDSGALGFLIREISDDDIAQGRTRLLNEVCGDP